MRAPAAQSIGLIDEAFASTPSEFLEAAIERAQQLAVSPGFGTLIAAKTARRAIDEAAKPLAAYRAQELERMRLNFFGFDPSYHVARSNFVRKVPKSRTPLYLARHRKLAAPPARAADAQTA
jgi:putative two-component system hydrogenase maturation factor HypX/HoxX